MVKRRNTAELLESAHRAGTAIQQQDRITEALSEIQQSRQALMPLSKILHRSVDTRGLESTHVKELSESISVLGLLEPLVVDIKGRLLAGGHRLAAISLLKETNYPSYTQHFQNDLVPVRVIEFDSEDNPDLALQIEVTENEKRRDYTPNEVRTLAERLKKAGYVDVKGRPATGMKVLRPALEIIIGKSIRTVRRYLNENNDKSRTPVTLSEQSKEINTLRRVKTELVRMCNVFNEADKAEMQAISKDANRLIKRIESVLKKLDI